MRGFNFSGARDAKGTSRPFIKTVGVPCTPRPWARLSSELVASLSLENDVVISRAFAKKADYEKLQVPFLMNVRREGILV